MHFFLQSSETGPRPYKEDTSPERTYIKAQYLLRRKIRIMERKRINRRQNISGANSEITLNEDEASSDTESDTSVTLHDTRNRDSPTFSDPAHVAQNNIVSTCNRFTPIEENDVVVQEPSTSSNPTKIGKSFPHQPAEFRPSRFHRKPRVKSSMDSLLEYFLDSIYVFRIVDFNLFGLHRLV